jgi:hypothetical protein
VTKVEETGKRTKRGGRAKGTPNKTTALLKDALLIAAEQAGGKAGMVGYLTTQASENPAAFMSLLGKVLPLQIAGTGEDGKIVVQISK